MGSVVAYSNDVKMKMLNVSSDVLDEHGAVSEPTVKQMVCGVCSMMGTDCAIATSGIAGPGGGTSLKPVGTVWISVKMGERIKTICKHFPGSRDRVIDRATTEAQIMLLKLLTE